MTDRSANEVQAMREALAFYAHPDHQEEDRGAIARAALPNWKNELRRLHATLDAEDEEPCSRCLGEGLCWDGADPLDDCPEDPHPCHACKGSGRGKDQVHF